MHINLWEWLLFKTYMVYSTFLEAIFTLLFFFLNGTTYTRRGTGDGM